MYWKGDVEWMACGPGAASYLNKIYGAVLAAIRMKHKLAVFIQPTPWGLAKGLGSLEGPDPNARIYPSFHLYEPWDFTHQGIYGNPSLLFSEERVRIKKALDLAFKEARVIVDRTGADIYAGEFGCVRWVPGGGAREWLLLALEGLAANRFGWTFHSYREWQGWDAEVDADAHKDLNASSIVRSRRTDRWVILESALGS